MTIKLDSRKGYQRHQQNRHTAREKASRYVYSSNAHSDKKRQSARSKLKRQLVDFNTDEFKDEIDYNYEDDLNEYKDWQEINDYIDAQWREIRDVIDLNDADLLESLLPPVNVFNGKEIYWTNKLTSREYTPFINILSHAIRIGHTKCIRILLDKIYVGELDADLIHTSYSTERVPLWNACELGDLDLVRELIEYAHVDVNAYSFLKLAVEQNNDILVDYLLRQGCDIQLRFNRFVLHHAAHEGYHCIVKSLLKYGADPNAQDYDHGTPLDYAIYRRDIEMIQILLENTQGHLHPNAINFTPMMLAVYHELRPMVDLLFRLLPFDQCIDDFVRLACRYTIDVQMENQEMAFYFFSQGLNRKPISDDLILYDVYESRRECQTLKELELIQNDDHAMRLQALLANERIFLQYGDAKLYIDMIQMQCRHYNNRNLFRQIFQLRLHAYRLILQVQNENHDLARLYRDLQQQICEDFFRMWEHDGLVSIDSLVIVANWMFDPNKGPAYNQVKFLKVIICMGQAKKLTRHEQHVLINIVRRIGAKHKIYLIKHFIQNIVRSISSEQFGQFYFTTLSAIRLLSQCETDVNVIFDTWAGDRPLHLIARCSNILEAKSVIDLLLAYGAHPDATNHQGEQPKDVAYTYDVRELLSTSRHLSLKCRCAQIIVSEVINYEQYVSSRLTDFIRLHQKTKQHSSSSSWDSSDYLDNAWSNA